MKSSHGESVDQARSVPLLIGHRGWPARYPENTLCGMDAALPAGARAFEIDVQMTRDGVPVVIHDADLLRTAGVPGRLCDMDYDRLREVIVDERGRLGRPTPQARIARLADTGRWLQGREGVTLFVELKPASLHRCGVAAMVDRVLNDLSAVRGRVVLISFDRDAVRHARLAGAACGWVLERWDTAALRAARSLSPDYLFCDQRIVPAATPLPPGPWCWALYDIVDPDLALQWGARGAAFIETWDIVAMLAHPALARRAGGG